MKLYYAPTSPYVRKVIILLEETGQRDDVELINVATTPVAADPVLLTKNPLAMKEGNWGTWPMLI